MSGSAGYVEILRTYNPIDIAMVKSLLDRERVDYFFRDEFFGYAYPWAQPARLMVLREQAFEAKEILRELILSYSVSGATPRPGGAPRGGRNGEVRRLRPGGEPGTGEDGCA